MLTADELVERFLSGDDDIGVFCHDSMQRQEVIQWLVDHGVSHGDSGESITMLEDEFYAEDKWMFVVCDCGGIEFYTEPYGSHEEIDYEEFLEIVNLNGALYRSTQVDDLL